MGITSFLIVCSIYWEFHTNAIGFKLCKTNVANEGWWTDKLTDAKVLEVMVRPIAYSFLQFKQQDGEYPSWLLGILTINTL